MFESNPHLVQKYWLSSSKSPRAIAVLELQILYTPAGRNLIKNASQAHKFSNTPHHRRRGGREGGREKKQK